MTKQIEEYCKQLKINIAGKLKFNPQVVEAMINCKSVVEYAPKSDSATELRTAFKLISNG